MIGDKVSGKVLVSRLLTAVNDFMIDDYELPEGYVDMGLFTTACDGVGYVAADDATKMANIEVAKIYSTYGGSGKMNDGQTFGMITGPTVSDVQRGLRYVREFVEEQASLYSISEDDSVVLYSECVSKIGRYFAKAYNLPQGSSIVYLLAPAIYGVAGIDEMTDYADVELVQYLGSPTHSNLCGGIFTGSQSQCRSAAESFKNAIFDYVDDPVEY
ncbi:MULTISPECIES: BMC domain-containing protein [Eubacterium]|uniref:Ethanolamine utilization protein EutL n=1 Tax=Eubacterium barkeri TaxID=1528 RepID=A0A1H3H8S3_EUBBA|nr:BMC domain-containing protein [Eubacterium barkeri]SDY11049.1 ethanolamine utilization protein EutL [Eubacterium barkeri]